MQFTILAEGLYECLSDSGEKYQVDIINKTCTCKGWFYKKWCKHLAALGVKK
jgi:hypothetical protein